MSFRSDDDAREERVRSLEKELEEARRELSLSRPKVQRLEGAEKEIQRLGVELAAARVAPVLSPAPDGPRAGGYVAGAIVVAFLVVGALALVTRSRGPTVDDGWVALAARDDELGRREEVIVAREAEVARREAEVTVAREVAARESAARDEVAGDEVARDAPVVEPREPVGEQRETPARSEIVAAMREVSAAVADCAAGEHGVASVRVRFGPDGRVSSAEITGQLGGTETGACIERAVRAARVPAFSAAEMTVTYPFRF